jgi:mono/diheme cytochrome c family protein
VGTRFFKEFSVDGRRIETRLIERIGTGPRDFAYASYLWDEDEGEARRVDEEGLKEARGTAHDIPSKSGCLRCHGTYALGGGRPSRALGFSALQLSHSNSGVTLLDLTDDGRLSHPPTHTFTVPGDPVTQAALGVLHANCGNCHNDTEDRVPQVDLSLWLETSGTSVEETGAWQTAVDQPTAVFKDQHVTGRIVPGQPDQSAVLYRMLQRGNNAQMPPLASHTVDEDGIAAIRAWIGSLP